LTSRQTSPNDAETQQQAKARKRAIVKAKDLPPESQIYTLQEIASKYAQHLSQVQRRYRRRLQDLQQLRLGKTCNNHGFP
jgi:phage terminase Nu1 subunit (DNA packaging protein)